MYFMKLRMKMNIDLYKEEKEGFREKKVHVNKWCLFLKII